MNYFFIFVAIAALLTLFILWWIIRPLRQGHGASPRYAATMHSSNLAALRTEMIEAKRDHEAGLMSHAAYLEAEAELEVRALHESTHIDQPQKPLSLCYKRTTIAIAILLPLLAIGGYALIGTPASIAPDALQPASTNAADSAKAEAQLNELFRSAEEKLKNNPTDAKGWYLLGRAKSSVGRYKEAMAHFDTAAALTPNDADLWADYADAAAGAAEGRLAGKPWS